MFKVKTHTAILSITSEEIFLTTAPATSQLSLKSSLVKLRAANLFQFRIFLFFSHSQMNSSLLCVRWWSGGGGK